MGDDLSIRQTSAVPGYLRQVVYLQSGAAVRSSWVDAATVADDHGWELNSSLGNKWAAWVASDIEMSTTAYVVKTPDGYTVIPTREIVKIEMTETAEDLG